MSDLRFNWSALPRRKFCSSACVHTGCPLSGVIQWHLQMRLESRSLAFIRGGLFKLIRRHRPGGNPAPSPPTARTPRSPLQPSTPLFQTSISSAGALIELNLTKNIWNAAFAAGPRVYCHFSMFGFIFRPTGAF